MKKTAILFLATAALLFAGCNSKQDTTVAPQPEKETPKEKLTKEEIQSRSFSELFDKIEVTAIPEDVFTLVGSDFTVITAGDETLSNSMVASWGGWGILFNKPTTWCFLRSNRYTLELMRDKKTYTMTYFDEEYKNDIMPFGMKSGKDSDKMKESQLTAVQTPSGNPTYKEAKLIIECKLTGVTTVSPNDFYTEEDRKFVTDAHAEANDYHKIVFGEITNVWVRK